MPIGKGIGAKQERPPALLSSTTFATDEAIDRRLGVGARRGAIGATPATQVVEALTLQRQLDAALGAYCLTSVSLARERRIVRDAIRGPLHRRIVHRNGQSRITRAGRVDRRD